MYIAILGRQPALGMAELERLYGTVSWFSDQTARIDTSAIAIEQLGGTQKAGRVVAELPRGDWRHVSMKIVQEYTKAWTNYDGKLTLGISAYGFDASARDVQKTGIILKSKLKDKGVSLRLLPNAEPALNTATSHHNKLGLSDNKVELLVVRGHSGKVIVAESVGAQNITLLAKRDQQRPKRDAFVGMLPPKLAQMMINMATPVSSRPISLRRETKGEEQPENVSTKSETFSARNGLSEERDQRGEQSYRILDPFCGTGVILQEAALMGYPVYGTDLSEKMINYSRENLDWLQDAFHIKTDYFLHEGDAMTTEWQQPIGGVVCESYLGQPFSAPPSPTKLVEVRGNCNHIISTFLKNINSQLASGTPLCIGVPAWRDTAGNFTHLPLIQQLDQFGFDRYEFKNVSDKDLLYYRENQVVARQLLVLTKR